MTCITQSERRQPRLYCQDHATDTDEKFADVAVHAIGVCARVVPESYEQILPTLFELLDFDSGKVHFLSSEFETVVLSLVRIN